MAEELAVSMSSIVAHVGDGKRCWEEGEAVLKAKHIVACGILSKKEDEIKIMTLCAQSSCLRAKPHEISVNVSPSGFKIECSCKAGKSERCKHCVAVLLYLNRRNLVDLEELSSTDVTQAWGTLKDPAWYAPTPLSDFCHVTENQAAARYPPLTSEEAQTFKRLLVEAAPDSALAWHEKRKRGNHEVQTRVTNAFVASIIARTSGPIPRSIPRGSLDDPFYIEKVVLSADDSVSLCCATIEQSSSNEWKYARSLRITASICYSLYTYGGDNWGPLLERSFSNTFKGSSATRFGHEHEGRARDLYCRLTGEKVELCGLVVPPLAPWLGCSPDGIIVSSDGKMRLLEIKCPALCEKEDLEALVAEKRLPYLIRDGENFCLKKKHTYFAQIQLSLELLDLESCVLCVYVKKSHRIVLLKVTRDREFGHGLVSRLTTVYFERVLPFLKAKYASEAV